jgi:nitronate monooxygenase
MSIPASLQKNLRLPAIVAPMFLASGPELVVETCRAGLIGTFPALNARTTEDLSHWLDDIEARLADSPPAAAFGVNLIVHKTNTRLEADLAEIIRHRVPLVITSLGAVSDIVKAIQSYGGLVFHDVISRRHSEKAAEAGVDGLIGVSAGAGGHAGTLNPFALLAEMRSVFSGPLILSGSMNTGRDIAAARMMGADFAYLGTRFLATREAMIPDAYKDMLTTSRAADILYTPNISGVPANFLKPSIRAAGLDPDHLPPPHALDLSNEAKAWKTIWSAGQGVGSIDNCPTTADLCASLIADYKAAFDKATSDPFI